MVIKWVECDLTIRIILMGTRRSAGSKWVHGWTWGSRVPTPNESNATKFSTTAAAKYANADAKSAINGSIATWTSRKYGTTTATTTNESWIWSTATKSLLKRKNKFLYTSFKKKKKFFSHPFKKKKKKKKKKK